MKKATNSALMRIKNEKIILSLINKEPVSRAEIAQKTGLTKAAVSIMIDDLKQRGIVKEQQGKNGAVGRNPVMLFLNEKAFYVIGVNVTRSHIAIGICDIGGNVEIKSKLEICSPEEAVERIKETIMKQLKEAEIDASQIYKLSVVTPGPVDSSSGVILTPPNFKEWHNFKIAEKLKEATGFITVLENVSSATAIAEKFFGAAISVENFLTILVDDGIGSGVVINDTLFKGPCELGHTSIKYDGIKCECGNRGCLEKYASVPCVLKGTTYKTWNEVVDKGDISLIKTEAEYLASAIISANNIFDFDKIVLCGALSYKAENLLSLISDIVKKCSITKATPKICAGVVESEYVVAAAPAIYKIFA